VRVRITAFGLALLESQQYLAAGKSCILAIMFFVRMIIPAVRRARSDRRHEIALLVPCNEERTVTGRLANKARQLPAASQYVTPLILGEGRYAR
jgi:hypothetical protein